MVVNRPQRRCKNREGCSSLCELCGEYLRDFLGRSSKDQLVGYVWNSRKKQLRFLSQKEADHLTHKRVVWKHLKEDWT